MIFDVSQTSVMRLSISLFSPSVCPPPQPSTITVHPSILSVLLSIHPVCTPIHLSIHPSVQHAEFLLELFKKRVDVVPREVVQWEILVMCGLWAWLILEVFSSLVDSMIIHPSLFGPANAGPLAPSHVRRGRESSLQREQSSSVLNETRNGFSCR